MPDNSIHIEIDSSELDKFVDNLTNIPNDPKVRSNIGYNEPLISDKKVLVSKLDFFYYNVISKGTQLWQENGIHLMKKPA